MIRLLEAFGAYTTAFLPASNKWDTAQAVAIQVDAGRSGYAGDNAALFDASIGSRLTRAISITSVDGIHTVTLGHAGQVMTIGASGITLASIQTTISTFDLILDVTGAVRVDQTTGGVLLGTVCRSADSLVPLFIGGWYLELQIVFQTGNATAVRIRLSDQFGDMNAVASGALLALAAGEGPVTLQMGGGGGETGTWLITDIYLTDGEPAATGQATAGGILFNDSFLGNTHVETFYPTADGTNLTIGNTPWDPDTGAVEYVRINEHPPDDDASYVEATEVGQLSTFVFQSPHPAMVGRLNCDVYAPIYGLQWDGRIRTRGDAANVAPIFRELVTGILADDLVNEGPIQIVVDTDYLYYPVVYDRNPISNDPFTFELFYPVVGDPGSVEIGMRTAA